MSAFHEIWSVDRQFVIYLLKDLPLATRADGVFVILSDEDKVLHIGHSSVKGDVFGVIENILSVDLTLCQKKADRVAVKKLKFSGSSAIFEMVLEDECVSLRQRLSSASANRD